MKTITAHSGQTIWDIAVQELGGADAVFDILDANDLLELDMTLPAGLKVNIPDNTVNRQVAVYFAEKGIQPVCGVDQESVITQDDMNNIKQDLSYNVALGDKEFDKVQLFFLRDLLSVSIRYESLNTSTVVFSIDQSLDGVNWSEVPYCSYILDPDKDTHTFNIVGILTNYVRGHLQVPDPSTGTINHIIWKT